MNASNRHGVTLGIALAVIFASVLSTFTLAVVTLGVRQSRPMSSVGSQDKPLSPPLGRLPVGPARSLESPAPSPSAVLPAHPTLPGLRRQRRHAPENDRLPRAPAVIEQPADHEALPVHLGSVTAGQRVYHAFLTPKEKVVRTLSVGGRAFGWHLYAADATSFSFEKEDYHYVVERR